MRRSVPSVWTPVLFQEIVRILLFPLWWYTDGVLLLIRWFRDGMIPSVRHMVMILERQRLFWRVGDIAGVCMNGLRFVATAFRLAGESVVYVLLLMSWLIVLPVAFAMVVFGG